MASASEGEHVADNARIGTVGKSCFKIPSFFHVSLLLKIVSN
jgi:hypothetical protein